MARRNNRNYQGKARDGWVQKPKKKGGLTRRQFGIVSAWAAALAGLGLGGKLVYDAVTYDPIAFLKRENDPVAKSIRDLRATGRGAQAVMSAFVPIGPFQARQLMDSNVYNEIKRKLSEDLRRAGLPYQEPKFLTKVYGVPDEERCVEPALDYCIKAFEFMAEHPELGALDLPEIRWKAVEKGEDHSKKYENTVFVGHSYFEVHRLKVPDPRNPKKDIIRHAAFQKSGGQCYFLGESDEDMDWMIYISAASSSNFLNSPFSEILPLGVVRQITEYASTLSPVERVKLMEAFSESFSHLLALDFCKKMKIPDSKRRVTVALESIVSTYEDYADVPGAIRYAEKHGMKDTALLFVNNPGEYRKRIRAE